MQLKKYSMTLKKSLIISSLSALSAILTIGIFLSGCSSTPEVVRVPYAVQKTIDKAPHPKKIKMMDVYFYVVNEDNFNEFKTRFIKKHNSFVFVAFSVKDYERLGLNTSELKRYIQQQKDIILYYEKSTEKSIENSENKKVK